jgi:hypothetical protein
MGTRSDVYIAIDKERYAIDLVANTTPKLLRDNRNSAGYRTAVYFRFMHVKWYDYHLETKAVLEYLDQLVYEKYGFLEIDEDGGAETKGDSDKYHLYLEPRRINSDITELFNR